MFNFARHILIISVLFLISLGVNCTIGDATIASLYTASPAPERGPRVSGE
jgi:hypothetical protein